MNIGEFFHMGGYAFYIWGSYGVAFILLTLEVALVVRQRRTLVRRLSRMYKVPTAGESVDDAN